MNRASVPFTFKDLTELSADLLGSFVLYATDDYFAEKENLLKPGAPEWLEGKYTDKGKWMDGWESQRRRESGHDFAIIRLGLPGEVHGVLVDTTHFKGNAPQEIALEGIEAPDTSTVAALMDSEGWFDLQPRIAIKPDFANVLARKGPSPRVTHVRLRIYPDGGVARLRVYGLAAPEPRTFWRDGSVDLAAVENGGTIAEVSDSFFGPPSNLLLPGRGANMGDGWETRRRRTPGSDWAVIRLGRRGVIDRVELDTHFFKGNAPQATLLEALDEEALGPEAVKALLREPKGWQPLVPMTALVQHRRHQLDPARPMPATHVRVHIFPHGGVNRLRLYGAALDTPLERERISQLNSMDDRALQQLLLSFCGAPAFAWGMWRRRPFLSVRELFTAAVDVWWSLDTRHWLQAYAAHPRLGSKKKGARQTHASSAWSTAEQRGVALAAPEVKKQLAQLNEAYFKKHGFIFIAFATGKSPAEVLAQLEARLPHPRKTEIELAAIEQAKITRRRIEQWLSAP